MNRINYGVFRGRELVQKRGSVGGYRNVFVKLQGVKNELVYPTFGGVIKNPFKAPAKMFAGDLCEYRTDANGVRPEIYLLKTFEVVSNTTTTVNIIRDKGFRHKPCVGDVIMVAPTEIGGSGTGVKVDNVVETDVTVGSVKYNVWKITTSASLGSLSNGTILVEAEGVGSTSMLVKNINAVIDCDCDFFGTPEIASNTNITTFGSNRDNEFDASRYLYTPALGGLMYTHKMSPIPSCVMNMNRSSVNGWFKVDYYDMGNSNLRFMSSKPTTATKGIVGNIAIVNSTTSSDSGVWVLTAISGTTYTWTQVAQKND